MFKIGLKKFFHQDLFYRFFGGLKDPQASIVRRRRSIISFILSPGAMNGAQAGDLTLDTGLNRPFSYATGQPVNQAVSSR